MIRHAPCALILASFLAACGSPQEATVPLTAIAAAPSAAPTTTPKAKPAPERIDKDTPRATAEGATFTAPAGWSIRTEAALVVLEGPDPELHIALFDTRAANADAAVAAAWAAYKPESKRSLKLTQPLPAREGWDEVRDYDYETSPNERAVVWVVAHRRSDIWTVFIVDAIETTFERRRAAVRLIGGSLRPKGMSARHSRGRRRILSTRSASSRSPISSRPRSARWGFRASR